MGKYMRTVLALAVGVALLAGTAQADERQANELRERANMLKEQVQRLHEEGKHDEAQQWERKVAELHAQADRVAGEAPREPSAGDALAERLHRLYRDWIEATVNERPDAAEDLQRKIHDVTRDAGARVQELLQPEFELLEQKIRELREQGKAELADRLAAHLRELVRVHEESGQTPRERREASPWQQRIDELERRLEELRRQGRPDKAAGPPDRGELERRMHHLSVAAENLRAVGRHDIADQLQREVQQLQQSLNGPGPQGDQKLRDGMQELREEIGRIHQRLNELNRRLDELSEALRRERN